MSNTNPIKKTRCELKCSWRVSSSCFLQDTRHVTHISSQVSTYISSYIKKKIEDIKGVIKSRKSKKVWQYNDQYSEFLDSLVADVKTTQMRLRCSYVKNNATKLLWSSSQSAWPLRNIHISNDNGYFPFYVDVFFPLSLYTRRRKQNKNTTQYVLDTTMCKQTQIMQIRHEPSYKKLEVKTNRTSVLCNFCCHN
jgi:hypothetical protein